jgi:phage terminase small subunit
MKGESMAKSRKPVRRQVTEGDPGHKGRKKLRAYANPKPSEPFHRNAGKELSPRARAIFDATVVELNEMGILGAPDVLILTAMANAYADASDARDEVLALRRSGKKTRDVLQSIARQEKREDRKLALFLKCSDRLGLSPRSRENLTVEKRHDADAELWKVLLTPRPKKRVDPAGVLRAVNPVTEELLPLEEPPNDQSAQILPESPKGLN